MRIVDAEIGRCHVNGNIDFRELRCDLVEHLLFAVFLVEVSVILWAEVAFAILKFQIGTVQRNLYATELSIHLGIRTSIPDHVVGGGIPLDGREHAAQIIGIEEGPSTGVAGQSRERLLAIGIAAELIQHRLA